MNQRCTISIWTYSIIIVYLYLSGAYIFHKSQENPLDTMCPEPYVCVIPPKEWKGITPMGLTVYKKIPVVYPTQLDKLPVAKIRV